MIKVKAYLQIEYGNFQQGFRHTEINRTRLQRDQVSYTSAGLQVHEGKQQTDVDSGIPLVIASRGNFTFAMY